MAASSSSVSGFGIDDGEVNVVVRCLFVLAQERFHTRGVILHHDRNVLNASTEVELEGDGVLNLLQEGFAPVGESVEIVFCKVGLTGNKAGDN